MNTTTSLSSRKTLLILLLLNLFALTAAFANTGNFNATTAFYYTAQCGRETQISIRLGGFTGNPGDKIRIGLQIDPLAFQVTDNGTYTAVPGIPGRYTTAEFEVYQDGTIEHVLSGVAIAPGPIQANFRMYEAGSLVCIKNIQSIPPTTISGVNSISNLYGYPGAPLLDPASAIVTPQHIRLSGTLAIDEDYTFGDEQDGRHTELVMEPGARIVVLNGASLDFTNTQVFGCNNPWDRILVLAGGSVTFLGARIEDPNVAVEMRESNLFAAASYITFNTEFKNVGTGLWVRPNTMGQKSNIRVRAYSSSWEGRGAGSVGWNISDLPQTLLLGLDGVGLARRCRFENFTHGVRADHCDLSVVRTDFFNCQSNGMWIRNESIVDVDGGAGFATFGETFVDMPIGVRSFDSDLTVKNCNFADVGTGIAFVSQVGKEGRFEHNYLEFERTGINVSCGLGTTGLITENTFLKSGDDLFSGVYVGNAFDVANGEWEIRENDVNLLENGRNGIFLDGMSNAIVKANSVNCLDGITGILVEGGSDNFVGCNTVMGGQEGLTANGTASARLECNTLSQNQVGLQIRGNCGGSYLRGNAMDGEYADLVYGDPGSGFAVTGNQPRLSTDPHHQNTFSLASANASGFSAIHHGNYFWVGFSTFRASSIQGPSIFPVYSANSFWWLNEAPRSVFSCPQDQQLCDIPKPGFNREIDQYDDAVIKNTLQAGSQTTEVRWNASRELYNALSEHGVQDPAHVGFQQQYANADIGQFRSLREAAHLAADYTESEKSALGTLHTQRSDYLIEIDIIIMNQLNAGVSFENLDQDEITEVLEDLEVANEGIAVYHAAQHNRVTSALPGLTAQNQAVVSTVQPGQNTRTVTEIALGLASNGTSTLSAAEVTTLEAIAGQCPISGGEAVFRARALLNLTGTAYVFDDVAGCGSGNQKTDALSRAPEQYALTTYPNPAAEATTLDLGAAASSSMRGYLYNLQGQQVLTFEVPAGTTSLSLNLSDLHRGGYLGRLIRIGDKEPMGHFRVIKQ